MINKTKYLFLVMLCAAFFGSAISVSAQSNVRGEADKLIQYYEWLFDTNFTSAQRSEYYQIKAEDFETDAAGEQKGIDSLMKKFTAIKAKSPGDQESVRGSIIGDFVKTLEDAGSDNREAVFLLKVYNVKQAADAKAVEANGTGNISAYVGKWVMSNSGTGTYIGGVYAGGSGSRFTYEFSPNGDVQFTGILNIMQGGCSQQVFQSKRGRASVNGNNLTISWQPEKFTRDFSCDKAGNYTKTIPAKVEKLKVSFKTDLGQRQMCLFGSDCYSKSNK